MQNGSILVLLVDGAAREATLFASIWFLIGGLDDLLVDAIYGWRALRGRLGAGAAPRPSLADIPLPAEPPQIALFVPAWDESAVIEPMLRTALERFDYPAYRIYVGTYPNDPATIAAVVRIAASDARVRLVIGPDPGPTTKADCLNTLWRALLRDEMAEATRFAAVALHDAEDVVHPQEFRVFAHMLEQHAAVQLPVLPLPHPASRWVSGHYCDEFAEAHGKQLVVRQTLGAGMPFAGVGCAIRRDMLGRIADLRDGAPFDASSLTEDYELGLTVSAMGGRTAIARVAECPGGWPVAVRAYFPARFGAAVRQKARWMTGIAFAGWDRIGWAEPRHIADHWMRMRDRRATLAMPVLAVAYCALVAWGASLVLHVTTGTQAPALASAMHALLLANAALLAWRALIRAAFVWRAYGAAEAARSLPRVLVSNMVALFAARRAVLLYLSMLAGGALKWEKTHHQFPDLPESIAR
ncbi:glycosyl transferase family protein [Sphingosinithalassobacter sp. CS137]|uniref:glycosyl transferase family protein n=1 Tax=Sphingosinithalassobacter sp. CS137 TaxID=2762748 RepID=UPI0021D35B98|nr:glycosyl transferase family protein [Sphingosinithalassobacter sp. CS137]